MPRVSAFERDLRAAFPDVTDESIKLAVAICNGSIDNDTLKAIPAVVALRAECFGMPSRHHASMVALDSLLGTHGVEHLGYVDMFDGPPIEYLNTGDSYVATVVWYRDASKHYTWRVQCYADAVEWCERKGISLEAY